MSSYFNIFFNFSSPKIFNLENFLLIKFFSFKIFKSKLFFKLFFFYQKYFEFLIRFKIAIFFFLNDLNPLFGSLLYKGICPPSKLFIATPDLDF